MKFFEPTKSPRVKICGLRSLENSREVIAAGADAIGLNFRPRSKRFIAPEEAATWLGELAGQVCRVGLFVDASIDEIEAAVDLCVLDALQLHGKESPEFCDEVSAFGLPVIKAIGVSGDQLVHDPTEFAQTHWLLDAFDPKQFGGTGKAFRWEVAKRVMAENPGKLVILAGGLTPENVADAVHAVSPHAVDTASGVESAPGIKDPELVRQFVANAGKL